MSPWLTDKELEILPEWMADDYKLVRDAWERHDRRPSDVTWFEGKTVKAITSIFHYLEGDENRQRRFRERAGLTGHLKRMGPDPRPEPNQSPPKG